MKRGLGSINRLIHSSLGIPPTDDTPSAASGNTPLPTKSSKFLAPPTVNYKPTPPAATSTNSTLRVPELAIPVPSGSVQGIASQNRVRNGLKTFIRTVERISGDFSPLSLGVGELIECLNMYESEADNRKEYEALQGDLVLIVITLNDQFDGPVPPQMTASITGLAQAIQKELEFVRRKHQRKTIQRYLEAVSDAEEILNCYRRIHRLLSQISTNANLNMWKIVDIQLAETRLRGMKISEASRYNSAESTGLLRGKCTPKTRRLVIDGLHAWVKDPNTPNAYWLNGMAGTGKTTIAYSFCAEREDVHSLGASFFCSRSSITCNNATLIPATIAYQLALFSYPFRAVLCQLLGEELDICNRDITTQFKRMIVDTLAKAGHSMPPNTVVVIDALDECSNQHDVRLLLEALLKYARQLPIKFFISSRAEGAIYPQMMSDPALRSVFYLHEVDASFVREDIELYVQDELSPIFPSPDQIMQLVQQADRLFIYAATVIRYVKRDGFDDYSLDRLDSLLQLPKSNSKLDDLYFGILSAAFGKPELGEQERTDMCGVLHTVVCAKEPLSVEALGVLLRPKRPRVIRTALQPFHSVLHVSQVNNLVTVLHASFPDYLLSLERAGQFCCKKGPQNLQLARLCLTRIGAVNPPFNICGLESSCVLDSDVPGLAKKVDQCISSELLYACRYWFAHVEAVDDLEEMRILVKEFLSSYLLLWMEIMNLKKCINVGTQILSKAQRWFQDDEHEEHLVSLVRNAYNFVTSFASSEASSSTPHIYVSTLALWPLDAPVSAHYRTRMRRLVEISGGAFESSSPLLARWSVGQTINCLAISADGLRFAIAHGCSLSVWDAYTGQTVLGPLENHTGDICSLAYSPNGARMISGSFDTTIRAWDAYSGHIVLPPFSGHTGRVMSVAYSPNGRHIVSGSFDKTMRVWDASTGSVVHVLEGHSNAIWSVICSPDSTTIASGCADGTIRIWDLRTGEIVHSPPNHQERGVRFVVYSPDGAHLASSSYNMICIWDTHTGQRLLGPFEWDTHRVFQLAYSPDGTHICSSDPHTPAVQIWDASNGKKIAGPLSDQKRAADAELNCLVAYSPDGARIISASNDSDGTICVWDAGTTKQPILLTEDNTSAVSSIAFSPDGARIISGSTDATISIWDTQSGGKVVESSRESGSRVLEPPSGHANSIASVAYSPNGSHIVSCSKSDAASARLIVRDTHIGQEVGRVIKYERSIQAINFAFFPEGLRVISGSHGPTICVWDAGSEFVKPLLEMGLRVGFDVSLLTCSPDNTCLASVSGQVILVWNFSNGRAVQILKGPGPIQCVAWSPDGVYMASAFAKNTMSVWDVLTGREAVSAIGWHEDLVEAIAYSPSGAHVTSGSRDGTIFVWDAHSGDQVAGPLRANNISIKSVAYSPDGTQIVAGSSDNTIQVWRLDRLAHGSRTAWQLTEDGWVINSLSRRLAWVPFHLRDKLMKAGEVLRVSPRGFVSLNFDNACIGRTWSDIYKTI